MKKSQLINVNTSGSLTQRKFVLDGKKFNSTHITIKVIQVTAITVVLLDERTIKIKQQVYFKVIHSSAPLLKLSFQGHEKQDCFIISTQKQSQPDL